MCGLVGMVRSGKNFTVAGKFLNMMAYFNHVRGVDSVGVMAIEKDNPNSNMVYKRALPIYDIMGQRTWTKLMEKSSTYSAVAIHNRAATLGTVTDANAHPFTHGNICLMHNGTIRPNHFGMHDADVPKEITVDSEKFAWILNEEGESVLPDVLGEIDFSGGAYAFIWHNLEEGTLNFLKNDQRSLYFLPMDKDDDAVVWASESWMAQVAADKCKVDVGTPIAVAENKIYKYHLPTADDKKLRLEAKELKLITPRKTTTYYNNGAKHTPTAQGNQYPTTVKRGEHIAGDLEAFGLKVGDSVSLIPYEYWNYEHNVAKNKAKLGRMQLGVLDSLEVDAVVFSVAEEYCKLLASQFDVPGSVIVAKVSGVTTIHLPCDDQKLPPVKRVVLDSTSVELYIPDEKADELHIYSWFDSTQKIRKEIHMHPKGRMAELEKGLVAVDPKLHSEDDFNVIELAHSNETYPRWVDGSVVTKQTWEEDSAMGCHNCNAKLIPSESVYMVYDNGEGNDYVALECLDCCMAAPGDDEQSILEDYYESMAHFH